MKKIIVPFFCAMLFATSVNAQSTEAKATTQVVTSKLNAQQVIDNYLKALGGKEKLEAVKTLITENSLTVQGMDVTMVTKKMGNKFKSVQTVMGNEMTQVFDGEKGYFNQMGQKNDIPADKIAELKKTKTIDALSYNASNYKTVTVEKLDNKDYNVLSSEKGKFYFDATTGLLYQSSSAEGSATIKSYITVDGIKFAEIIDAKGGGQEMTIKTTKVTVNSGVTEADFKL